MIKPIHDTNSDYFLSSALKNLELAVEKQNEERTILTNELYDNLGSNIATMKLFIDDLNNDNTITEHERKILLHKLKDLSDNCFCEIKKINDFNNFGLSIDTGLIPAVKDFINQFSEYHNARITIHSAKSNIILKNSLEIQLIILIQEILVKIIKQLEIREGKICFTAERGYLKILFQQANIVTRNFNKIQKGDLKNIANRLKKINGELKVASSVYSKSLIRIKIPI